MTAVLMQSKAVAPAVKADCIDLRELFGASFQIGYEEAHYAEHGEHPRVDDPWLQLLRCRHGEIYPLDGDRLAASTYGPGKIANQLAALECCQVEQDGRGGGKLPRRPANAPPVDDRADGVTVSFKSCDFPKIATLMKARPRKKLSKAQRAALSEGGRPHRFRTPGANGKSQDQGARLRTPEGPSGGAETR
jgi:hypothetical protein